jgi:hypothetical protein
MATYLTRRLSSKNNPNIKYKCLKVIAKVSVDPVTRGLLKRAVTQDPNAVIAIKEALQFRGPPDAARGDELNERVRAAAKEALDAIYSDTPASESSVGRMGVSSASYAPSPHSQVQPGAPISTGRMQGIGNPMYADPRLETQKGIANMTLGEVVGTAGETIVAMVKDPLARNIDVPPPRSGNFGGYSGGSYSGPPPGRSQLASATNGQWTMASNRGPGAVGAPQNYNSDRDAAYFKARDSGSNAFSWAQQQSNGGTTGGVGGGVGGSWGASSGGVASQAGQPAYGNSSAPSVMVQQHAPPSGTGGTATSDGSYERNLIMELCPPGGMKAEPPPDKLASFARAVPSLDPDLVCPALLDCLEEGQPWIIRAKALCVMEVAIGVAEENSEGSNAYADFFHACRGEIEPLASHPRAAIKEPAKRVLRALGIESAGVASGGAKPAGFRPPNSTVAAPVAEAPNLLDFDEVPTEPAAVPPPAVAPPTQPPADSLFGGLKTKEHKAAPPGPPPPPPPSTPATVASVSSTTGGADMFGDMTVKSTPASAAPPAAITTPTGIATAVDAAPVGSGSAFGFMNASPAAAETPAPPTATQSNATSPAAAAGSFDPLLSLGANVSPSTQKPALTPAQMQQLAYQQLMMQQQQQMQMAYAMQQQQMAGGMPMQPNMQAIMMQQHQMGGPARSIMSNNAGAAASSPFSFIDAPSKKKEDKQFDFVKETMKHEK